MNTTGWRKRYVTLTFCSYDIMLLWFVCGSLADIMSCVMCVSEGGRERGKPPVGRSRAILWPAAVSGRRRRGHHHERPGGGSPRSTWCDLSDWKWKSSASEHHHSPCDRHGNLTIQSNGRFHVCLFVREGTPSCFTKHSLVCVQLRFMWAVLLYCGQLARAVESTSVYYMSIRNSVAADKATAGWWSSMFRSLGALKSTLTSVLWKKSIYKPEDVM